MASTTDGVPPCEAGRRSRRRRTRPGSTATPATAARRRRPRPPRHSPGAPAAARRSESPAEPGRGQERLDPVGGGGARPQPFAQGSEGRDEAPEVAGQARLDVLAGEPDARCRRRTRTGSAAGRRADTRRPASRAKRRSGLPDGWCSQEPPRSTGEPARSTVCSRPPTRPRASRTTHSTPAWWSALATVSPAMPAPTTRTRRTGPAMPPGTSRLPSSKRPALTGQATSTVASEGEPGSRAGTRAAYSS